MKKMTTLYKKDPNDLGRVINEVDPENEWVFDYGIATRKYDGTACMIQDGVLYKRYDCRIKSGKYKKPIPEGAIPCQPPDLITGHHPHWVRCDRDNPSDKYHFEAFDRNLSYPDGTYELCGEKVQGNPEKLTGHWLIRHGLVRPVCFDFFFDGLRKFFLDPDNDIEGIVFYHALDGRMCKIRKSDFGIKRS